MSFPRYPEYKDSGIEWLGEVPAHWEVKRLSCVATILAGFPFESSSFSIEGVPVIRMSDFGEGRLFHEDVKRVPADVVPSDAYSMSGDILLGLSGSIGNFAIVRESDLPVAINQRVAIVRGYDVYRKLLPWLLQSPEFQEQLRSELPATTIQNISMGQMRCVRFSVPVLLEDIVSISDFLEDEALKLDELIAEQEKLIALLKEKRQAVISHAVTKGLDPTVPMKDSGIEWLGEVPAHWQIVPLGRITVDRCDGPFGSGLKSEHYSESGVRVIRLQNIRRDGFDGEDAAYIDENYYKSLPGHDVIFGDVLVAGLGDDNNTLGRACVAPRDIEPAMVKADCFRFRLDTRIAFPEFIATQLTAGSEPDAGVLATGTTRSRIPLSVMASRRVILPPLAEQEAIAKLLARQAELANALLAEATKGIDLLKERRSALISAAVTGKIDVRQCKARVFA